jgi:hypothetical protein
MPSKWVQPSPLLVRNDLARVPRHCFATSRKTRAGGFDPNAVPDLLAPAYLERPTSRGLPLMRHYLTSVDFNQTINRVTLCRCRPA